MTINHHGVTFESDGEVVYAIPGAGMGLHFENSETGEEDAIKDFLVQLTNEVIERVRERVSFKKRKIVLILGIVALAATVAGLSILLGVLR